MTNSSRFVLSLFNIPYLFDDAHCLCCPLQEVPAYKLITPAVVSERLKIRGSLARKALNELQQKGLIKQVVKHSAQLIYTRAIKGDDAADAPEGKEQQPKGKKGAKAVEKDDN